MSKKSEMFKIMDDISKSRWFCEPSEFYGHIQKANPKLCVITGDNASGKSIIRKVVMSEAKHRDIEYIHLSQAARCRSGDIVRQFIYGSEEDDSTGNNTCHMILKSIQTGQGREKPFMFFYDEPEIGCGEELQAAIGDRIVRDFETMSNMVCTFIVTHSRQVVKHLLPLNPTHWRLNKDHMTLERWIEREVKPISMERLQKTALRRWRFVAKMTEKDKR